ncbi:MAG: tRNA epoxyqueuosine(34) reductase QueG [Bacteroidia bacterium]|nr:tRNA epoxyqueuosine(34) reductase QueG [Bacteroidia bacterium]
MQADKASQLIKQWATEAGFMLCGIVKAEQLDTEAVTLEKWLNKGYHGKMSWIENYFDMRIDPRKLVPGAKSVICLAYNYFPENALPEDGVKIARYAYGKDYHYVIKNKMAEITKKMQKELGDFVFRVFTDSAPILESSWAGRAGLGWVGKNTILINKQHGSFFLLAEIICDLDLEYDIPYTKDYCGTCTACIDACPTEAILPDKTLNAQRCISYLTIELKEEIPTEFRTKMEDWVFGCDVCQEVCPWNRFSSKHNEPEFNPHEQLFHLSKQDWLELTEDIYKEIFRKSAVKRAGYSKLFSSIKLVKHSE